MPKVQLGEPYKLQKVLFVEGDDEARAIRAMLQQNSFAGIEIRDLHGNSGLDRKLRTAVKATGFSQVQSIGVLLDAESSYPNAWNDLAGALAGASLVVPPAPLIRAAGTPDVTVFISPDNASAGAFEQIFLASAVGDPADSCIDAFAACVTQINPMNPAREAKLRIQAYLAAKGYRLIGEAADRRLFDWKKPAFGALLQFLQTI